MGDQSKPRVLISNDDGVSAPGLVALAKEIHSAGDFCDFVVCGPLGERSAQSHCISISKPLVAFKISVEGAQEAYAVDGSPADSVMMALHSPLLENPKFDLVVSGINRGDNCGLHVIYSGTVGAAREAACKDLPALAFSLDSYTARSVEQYAASARYSVSIIKAALGILPSSISRPLLSLRGHVLNINYPKVDFNEIKGLYLCPQGYHCSFPDFKEVDVNHQNYVTENGHQHQELRAGNVTLRAFHNSAGFLRTDERHGTDSWAVHNEYVAVTPLGLVSDIALTVKSIEERKNAPFLAAVAHVLVATGKDLNVSVTVPEELLSQ